ncbi:MAG: phosphoenolpyruvate synthase, partial [Chloroflexi bacterium]|nr:phosphoenolpyruvate synthase [Chloroflexota bacterium]
MNYVRTFEQCNVNDVNLVGGKGANLGEMTRAKLPVPPGFSLTADAYRAFIRAADAQSTIARALAGLSIDDTLRVEKQTQIIRDFLIAQAMPRDIAAQALASYRALAKELGGRVDAIIPVAVRSSATAEDLPTASFAGQQDTYLNIRGDAELLAHVKQCWASLWTARAVT